MLEQTRATRAHQTKVAEAITKHHRSESIVLIDAGQLMSDATHEQLALSPVLFAVIAVLVILVFVPFILMCYPLDAITNQSGKGMPGTRSQFDSSAAGLPSHAMSPQRQLFVSPPTSTAVIDYGPAMASSSSQMGFTLGGMESGRSPQANTTSVAMSPCLSFASPYTQSRMFVERCMLSHRTACGGRIESVNALEVFTWMSKDSIRDLYETNDQSTRHLAIKNNHGVFGLAKTFHEGGGGGEGGNRPPLRLEIAFLPNMQQSFHGQRMFVKPAFIISPLQYPATLGHDATIRGGSGEFYGYFQRKRRDFVLSGGSHEVRLVVEPVEIGLVILVYSGLAQIAAVRIANHRSEIRIDVKEGADRNVVIATALATMIASQDVVDYFKNNR